MKKIFYLLALPSVFFLLSAPVAKAQFEVGTNVLNIGIGLGSYLDYGNVTPAISLSLEHGTIDLGSGVAGTISFGGIISFQHSSYSLFDNYSFNTTFIAARGMWHPNLTQYITPKVDLYGGIDLGVLIVTTNIPSGHDYAGGGFRGGIVIGGRYYFTDNLAGFLELGYDDSFAKLGLSIKFGGK